MCSANIKGRKKLSSTLSDKYPPFVMLKQRGKVLHPNVCCGAPLFVSVASLLKGHILKKCRASLRLLHVDAVECVYCMKLKKQGVTNHGVCRNPEINFNTFEELFKTIFTYFKTLLPLPVLTSYYGCVLEIKNRAGGVKF